MDVGINSPTTEVEIPTVGRKFASENELREYYKGYGQSLGFGICKLGAKNGADGKQKYFTIACAKGGTMKPSRGKNVLQPRPSTKTNCKAKMNIVVRGECEYEIVSVCLEHNHPLSPAKSRHFRSHKVLDANAKRRLELNDVAGITLAKSFQSFVVEAGGYENISFDERNCRNFISESRRLRLGNGDAEALCKYFQRMKGRSSTFDYAYDLDDESRIRNVFWADGRCRAAYEYFSDVISFDTTYLTNQYDMPFAPFVGVNHHGQSILLGCGLLSSEDSASFKWLFNAWLTCMHDRAPKAIITDQCRSMAIAIENVFPNTKHRYCLWHILKKLPSKFAAHAEYDNIKKALKKIVYNSITIEQCEEDWMKMIEDFGLENNDWLNSLYSERTKWIPVYVKSTFWAGMSTSQRSESMNSFFDDFVHSKTSLKQFVEQYDRALQRNIEKERKLDFQSFNSLIPIVSGYSLERQFQAVYTNDIFKLFQNEMTGLMFSDISLSEDDGTTIVFVVVETILGSNGDHWRNDSYKVNYTPVGCLVECQCRMFEFRGLLCRHILAVLRRMKVNMVPDHYILNRWRKDLKRGYQSMTNIYDFEMSNGERNRFNYLTPRVLEAQQLAAKSEQNCSLFDQLLTDMVEKFTAASTPTDITPIDTAPIDTSPTPREQQIHSPVKVRSRGRPSTKRKQATIEKVINKAARRPRKKVGQTEGFSVTTTVTRDDAIRTQQEFNDPVSSEVSFTALLTSQSSHVPNSTYADDDYGIYVQRR